MDRLSENSSFSPFIVETRKMEPKWFQPMDFGDTCILPPPYWWVCLVQFRPFVVSRQTKLFLHVLGSYVLFFCEWDSSLLSKYCQESTCETVCFAPNLTEQELMEMVRTGAIGNWEDNTEDMNGCCGRLLGAVKYHEQTVGGARQVTGKGRGQVRGTGHLVGGQLLAH